MSAILFGGLALAAGVFAFWIYERRELPIAGRRILASARATSLVLIVALLWNPSVPAFGADDAFGRWTLLDGSLSMGAAGSGGVALWSEALRRARDREAVGDRIMVFGSGLGVPTDGLPDSAILAPVSRLAPALERVWESGSRDVVVISDLRLSDPEAVGRALGRLGMSVRFDVVGDTPRNVAVPVADLPALVASGDGLVADVSVRSMGTSVGDSVLVEVREEGDLRASRTIPPPPAGRLTRLQLSLPPSSSSGLVRYEIRASLAGDVFPDDDARVRFVEIDREGGGLVLVSLRPDWEPRFLMPVLEQISGLQGRGYLRLSEGRFVPLSVAGGASAVVDDAAVQGMVETAEVLVVHAASGDMPPWLTDALAGASRSIVFLDGAGGARSVGLGVGAPLSGEWYASAEIPPSALASSLAGVPWTGLPPLTGVLALTRAAPGLVPLELRLQGSGPAEAALVLQGTSGKRQAVVLASGFWRWAFRDGAPRAAYRRLWAGVVGWMLASDPLGSGPGVAPTERIVRRGDEVVWRAGSWVGLSLRFVVSSDGAAVADTVLVVDPLGDVRTGVLGPGTYDYRVESGDSVNVVGQGRFEVEAYTAELLTPVYRPTADSGNISGIDSVGRDIPGRPLRTYAFPYLLLVGLLSGEWIGRRRRGLR
ncbi:MAG: hypothetical protein BMS9Abin29_1240 [Gemmatimonadota bacterium]|nr:MAG: hypothetical protein BMS9Abin29_1240 [Gemmatimonadota bacterium]